MKTSLFKTGDFFYTESDNYLKQKFANHLASLAESGIDVILTNQGLENRMKVHATTYVKLKSKQNNTLTKQNLSDWELKAHVSHWMKNKCFTLYLKDKCSYSSSTEEIPVSLKDFIVVWLLLTILLLSALSLFVYEHFQKQLKIFETSWS